MVTHSAIGTEALDDPATDPALVTRMLADIARSNTWLGGAAAVRCGMARLLDRSDRGRTLTLFDVGTGSGDLPRDAVRWAVRHGISLVPLGLERITTAAQLAKRNGVPVVVGCASALPLGAKSVDIVLASQLVHHLDRESAIECFRAWSAVARRGVVVADLHRRWFAAPGFRLAGAVLRLHRQTIEDGVTSVRRGYTVREMQELCVAAGISGFKVAARPGARVVAWWRV
ncbi:MAG: methyltransferase domain-containing protein [Gemmatimonadota bacterium]